MNSVSRRVVLRGSLALGAIATAGVAAPAAQALPPLTETPDQQLDRILQAFESMPQHLKEADPKTYPNYEKAIEPYLKGLTTITMRPNGTGARPNFNFLQCAAALAGFVATNGFAVLKIIGWIKKARKIWGGVKGIYHAIVSGDAAANIGAEAATVLGSLLGVQGIAKWCFS